MSRGTSTTAWRPALVWTAVTLAAGTACDAVPGAWQGARGAAGHDRVADALVTACAVGSAVALTWLWVITTVTVVELVAGRAHRGGGATRRLVLVACGVAVVAGVGVPAGASAGDGRDLLVGLPMPERALTPAQVHPAPTTEVTLRPQVVSPPVGPGTYVVRPGDSLWSIAHDHPDGPGSGGAGSVDQRWRAIWQANRDVVGDDPDLIIPGQTLRLPTTFHSDGDR